MAALVKVSKFSSFLIKKQPAALFNAIRQGSHWNKDWKPGPYPKTEEERRKAAEKYGLHPDAYEPYPDDGMGFGDYPKVPMVSGDQRDPFYPWDYPGHKLNFNEPIHVLEECINETRFDANRRHYYPMWQMWTIFLGVTGAIFGSFYLLERDDLYMHPPVLAKQYPGHQYNCAFKGKKPEDAGPHH